MINYSFGKLLLAQTEPPNFVWVTLQGIRRSTPFGFPALIVIRCLYCGARCCWKKRRHWSSTSVYRSDHGSTDCSGTVLKIRDLQGEDRSDLHGQGTCKKAEQKRRGKIGLPMVMTEIQKFIVNFLFCHIFCKYTLNIEHFFIYNDFI